MGETDDDARGEERQILYVDMDNVLVDFKSGIDRLPEPLRREYDGRLDEVPGIFGLMDPMPGAVEAFTELAGVFYAYVLSTAPWENATAWSQKLDWVKRFLGAPAYKRLILSHHKNLNLGHYLVDDRTKNGADGFAGEHIHFGTPAFPDWKAVRRYLLDERDELEGAESKQSERAGRCNTVIQAILAARGLDEVAARAAGDWLAAVQVLADSPTRRGLPLRRLLRAGQILGAYQNESGFWFIRRV